MGWRHGNGERAHDALDCYFELLLERLSHKVVQDGDGKGRLNGWSFACGPCAAGGEDDCAGVVSVELNTIGLGGHVIKARALKHAGCWGGGTNAHAFEFYLDLHLPS